MLEEKLAQTTEQLANANNHIANLDKQVTVLDKQVSNLEMELHEAYRKLNEAVKKYEKEIEAKNIMITRQFMPKNEKNKKDDIIINEVEIESPQTIDEVKEKKKRGRKEGFSMKEKFETLDASIIRESIIVSCVDELCAECNSVLVEIESSRTHKVEIIPSQIKVIEYIYEGKKCEICNITYRGSSDYDIYPGSSLTASLASELLVNKYVLGIPLYRLEAHYNKLGLTISRQSMANYLMTIALDLEPLYDLMKQDLINNKAKVIHCDETTLTVINTTDENRMNCYMWLYATSFFDVPIYIYEFQESREGKHVKNFLKDYSGYISTDGYQAYRNIDNVEMAACWAHLRRKYFDIVKTLTKNQLKDSIAKRAVDIIDKLFEIERKYRELKLNTQQILQKRQLDCIPIVGEYEELINSITYEASSALGRAIEYGKNLMPNLKTFLHDGHIELSNNLAERGIKPFVMSRRNFLFSYSLKGASASAINFSLIQTAKANGLDVRKYLAYVISQLSVIPMRDLPDLLPYSKKMVEMFRVVSISR